ncbi:MAG: Mth938-like domain-containing protein [Planctomycetota bacterium]|jgi:hypothetical protein
MHIDSYEFGNIVIDGTAYSSDCLIFGDSVQADWWRKQGHLLAAEDLQPVLAAKPSVLVVGCGTSRMMKVSEQTRQALQQQNIELIALATNEAVEKFNELNEKGQDVAAALHLTC